MIFNAELSRLMLALAALQLFYTAKSHAKTNSTIREQILQRIFDGYDPTISPYYATGKPITVEIAMEIYSIGNIDEIAMELTVSMYIRLRWNDSRLEYDPGQFSEDFHVTLDYRGIKQIWLPDLTMIYQKRAVLHSSMVPNTAVWISPNGSVLWSESVTLTVSCPMCLRRFPHDVQKCKIELESYTLLIHELNLKWADEYPVELSINSHWNKFLVEKVKPYITADRLSAGHTWSKAGVEFTFHRTIGYFYAGSLIPSTLLVSMSWISFWISHDAAPARVSLPSVLILSEITHISNRRHHQQLNANYIMAIDLWDFAIFILLFSSLVQFAIVSVLARHKKPPRHDSSSNDNTKQLLRNSALGDLDLTALLDAMSTQKGRKPHGCKLATRFDKICRFAFPVLFFLFVFTYFGFFVWWPSNFFQCYD